MAGQGASARTILGSIMTAIALIGFAWFYFGGGMEEENHQSMQQIKNDVAEDAVQQYRIAAQSGTVMDRCVHAGLVAAAYIQAQDQEHYAEWKQVEKKDCQAAGVPQE